jgi:hypothetical protein
MRRFTSDIRKENILFPRRGWITGNAEVTPFSSKVLFGDKPGTTPYVDPTAFFDIYLESIHTRVL